MLLVWGKRPSGDGDTLHACLWNFMLGPLIGDCLVIWLSIQLVVVDVLDDAVR